MKLSAIILSKGEVSTQKAIESVQFADETVVVLDSVDDSKLKKSPKVKIINHDLAGNYSQQRNFSATQVKGDWLLYLDSDEIISPELAHEITSVINVSPPAGGSVISEAAYRIKRRDFFWGKQLRFGETKTAREVGFIRLIKKNTGTWVGTVHEKFVSVQKPVTLKGYIDHFPHQTISEFLQSVNEYSTVRAKELKNNGAQFSTLNMVFYPLGKFIYTYFIKLGFLDGAAGFAYSFMMSFHSFLVRAKLLNL